MSKLTQDKLWKAIFEDCFQEAIAYFLPEFYPTINWERGYQLLDKELQQIFPESAETHRRADLLAKVWLLDGQEQWLLIHVEVQGYKDPDFAHRMFVYYYRLTDRFAVPVSALALLTDPEVSWVPDTYHFQCMGTELVYRYPVYKLAVHSPEEFDADANMWALVMKSALLGLHAKKDDDALLQMKINLYRDLRKHGYEAQQAKNLLQFIKYYVRFGRQDYFSKFDDEINKVENKKTEPMGIIELVSEHLLEEAEEKGIEKGQEKMLLSAIPRLLEKDPSLTDKELAGIFAVPVSTVLKVKEKLARKSNRRTGKDTQQRTGKKQ